VSVDPGPRISAHEVAHGHRVRGDGQAVGVARRVRITVQCTAGERRHSRESNHGAEQAGLGPEGQGECVVGHGRVAHTSAYCMGLGVTS
jgi:hypothetical protein